MINVNELTIGQRVYCVLPNIGVIQEYKYLGDGTYSATNNSAVIEQKKQFSYLNTNNLFLTRELAELSLLKASLDKTLLIIQESEEELGRLKSKKESIEKSLEPFKLKYPEEFI